MSESNIWIEVKCTRKGCPKTDGVWKIYGKSYCQGTRIKHICKNKRTRSDHLYGSKIPNTNQFALEIQTISQSAYRFLLQDIQKHIDESYIVDKQDIEMEEHSSNDDNDYQLSEPNQSEQSIEPIAMEHGHADNRIANEDIHQLGSNSPREYCDDEAPSEDPSDEAEGKCMTVDDNDGQESDQSTNLNKKSKHTKAQTFRIKSVNRSKYACTSNANRSPLRSRRKEQENDMSISNRSSRHPKKRTFDEMENDEDAQNDEQEIMVCFPKTQRNYGMPLRKRKITKHDNTKLTLGIKSKLALTYAHTETPNVSLHRNRLNEICSQTLVNQATVLTFGTKKRRGENNSNPVGGLQGAQRKYDYTKIANQIAGVDLSQIPPTPQLPKVNFLD